MSRLKYTQIRSICLSTTMSKLSFLYADSSQLLAVIKTIIVTLTTLKKLSLGYPLQSCLWKPENGLMGGKPCPTLEFPTSVIDRTTGVEHKWFNYLNFPSSNDRVGISWEAEKNTTLTWIDEKCWRGIPWEHLMTTFCILSLSHRVVFSSSNMHTLATEPTSFAGVRNN